MQRSRRRLRFFSPPHWGPWHHPGPFGPHFGWGSPWWGSPWMGQRPSIEEEKEVHSDYIATLREELEDAEVYLKELEANK